MNTPETAIARNKNTSDQALLPRPRSSRLDQVGKLRQASVTILRAHCQGQTKSEFEASPYQAEVNGITISLRRPDFWLTAYSVRLEYLKALSQSREADIDFLHGLDIWVGPSLASHKVLNIQWDLFVNIHIISFRRGPWEEILLTEAGKTP